MNKTTILEEKLEQANHRYFALYKKLKQWAEAVWKDNIVVHEQIIHGVSHSDKIAEYAGIILQNKLQTNTLNPEELFLLIASIYLHDTGMQIGWKESLDIKGTMGELTKEERFRTRKEHADTSAFVIRSWQEHLPASLDRELTEVEKDILCHDLNEALAFVCQCHNRPNIAAYLDRELNRNQRFRDRKFNISLVAAVLQLCDALDMDKNRLIDERFRDNLGKWLEDRPMEVIYDDKDWKRFFQCHFVEEVRLESKGVDIFKISIDVRFNREEDRDIRDRFLEIYYKRLQKTRHDCVTVINREAGIHFLSDYPFNILDANSTKIKIPAKLVHLFREEEKDKKEEKAPPARVVKTGLTGRDRDIEKLRVSIKDMRETLPKKVITLKGAPGIGKTVLARVLLQQKDILSHFTHGCYFISLEGVETKENLALQINTHLGISQNAEEAPLLDYIAHKNILIILDNFEDPLTDRSETSGLVRRLLGQCGSAVLVCTSREALRDAAIEVIYPVDKLDRQSAKELLISLACAQGCDEKLPGEELDALLEELDDVPLAISLAAPYLAYGGKRLLDEIKTRGVAPLESPLIDKNSRDKYSSLDRCFLLSYRTIEGSDADQLFQAAALFPAGFTPGDMEGVLPGIAFHHLITLESKSLLVRHKQGEFSMLAPLRHYAYRIFLNRARPNDPEKQWLKLVIEKSREYKNTVYGKGSKGLNRLVRELPNIFRALDYLLEGASPGKDIKEELFELLGNMVDFLSFQGINRQAKDYLETAVQLAREAGDTANEAYCILKLGAIFFYESRNRDAMEAFQQALPLYKKIGDLLGEANCIKNFGRIHIEEGNIKKGKNHLEQALQLYETIDSTYSIANACYEYALLLKDIKGQKKQAKELFQKAEHIFESINLPKDVEKCKKQLGT